MKGVSVLVLILLAACNAPGPHFRDLPATRVSVADSVFDVRVRGELAEALRINPQYAPRLGVIRNRAAHAMAAVSGCRVKEVRGDQAMATGVLDCPDTPANGLIVPQTTGAFECLRTDRGQYDLPDSVYEDYDCDPV
jgi:hypothetical protein